MVFKNRSIRNLGNLKYRLVKKGVTSGASRFSFSFKNILPLQQKIKHLHVFLKNKSGRSNKGRVLVWTKSKRFFKKTYLNINYNFRYNNISFISSVIMVPFSHKLISLIFLSTGSLTYVPTTYNHSLFCLRRMYNCFQNIFNYKNKLNLFNKKLFIIQDFFVIKQLPKNQTISNLELLPGKGVQYVRSPGSKSLLTKFDYKNNTTLIKLPSGVRKIFSIFALGSLGSVPLVENKYWKSNKAGFYKNFGVKSKVRGVAMNPVDHPHGGRTKTIKHPRTPWGKTTKFK